MSDADLSALVDVEGCKDEPYDSRLFLEYLHVNKTTYKTIDMGEEMASETYP